MKPISSVLLMVVLLLTTACKVELFTQLAEKDANEMMAVLLKHQIICEKLPGKDDYWVLRVPESHFTSAVESLKSEGYPKQHFKSIDDIFKKEGFVSSPLTERVRYVYALSQELSNTISRIDGVLEARVHVVLPDNDPLSPKLKPSSASVFVMHRVGSPINDSISQIKQLVMNSIEGLTYDNVSVALFPSTNSFIGPPAHESQATSLIFLIPLLLTLAIASFGWYRHRRLTKAAEVDHV